MRRQIGTETAAFSLLLFILFPSSTNAQTLQYRPVVGQTIEFGIEYRLICQDAREPEIRKRCRIRYDVVAVTDEHWDARFATHPFTISGPFSGPEAIEGLMRSLSIDRNHTDALIGVPDFVRSRLEAADQRIAAMRKAQLEDMRMYPGLFQFCTGHVRANFQGELLAASASTNVPMLVGNLTALPLIRLSDKDISIPFGYKDIRKVNLFAKEDNAEATPAETSVSLLQTMTLKPTDQDNLKAFDLEIEMAGGLNVGAEIRVTGSGYSEFSLDDNMPLAGNTDYEAKGLTFAGRGESYLVRVSFQRLDAWRRQLFDAMLLPTSHALDTESLPRLTPQQMSNLRKHFGVRPGSSRVNVAGAVFLTAPPPMDSSVYQAVQQMADRDPEQAVEGIKSSQDRHDMSTAIASARAILARWRQIWKAATIVQRDWSDASESFSITARMLGRTETDVALQRIDNGKRIYVPLDRLSDQDREIAETFALSPDAIREIH